jgi:hypothetical protein
MRYLKTASLYLASLSIILSTFLISSTAEAVPSFSRQTGMPCMGCHYQSFPALNSFGRSFRADGYTMQGTQPMIEGENLSLPSTLNASVITKIRYQLKDNDAGDRGEIQWPDEAALLIGGRAAENVGFLMELGMGPQDVEVDTGTGEGEAIGNFLSAKFHFAIGDSFAIIPFSTDGLGVGYGFELLNTGVQRSQRPIENRAGYSAGQLLGTASGEATGIAFVYKSPEWFVNYSHWAPTWSNVNADILGGLAHYFRAGYTPNIGGWDAGFGISMMSGSVKAGNTDPATEIFVDGWGVDAQIQGMAGSMPLGVYASYGVAPKSSATEENLYNIDLVDDATAYGLLAKLEVIAGTSVYVAHSSKTLADTTAQSTLGVQHMVAQNIKLELFGVNSDSATAGSDYTMLMLFAGF